MLAANPSDHLSDLLSVCVCVRRRNTVSSAGWKGSLVEQKNVFLARKCSGEFFHVL